MKAVCVCFCVSMCVSNKGQGESRFYSNASGFLKRLLCNCCFLYRYLFKIVFLALLNQLEAA